MPALRCSILLVLFPLLAYPELAQPESAKPQTTEEGKPAPKRPDAETKEEQNVRPNVARSLSELRDRVSVGETLLVTGFDGRKVEGELEGVSADGLKLRTAGLRIVSLPESEVWRVDLRYRDPLWNGTLIGAAIGTGLFLVLAANAANSDDWDLTVAQSAAAATLVFVGPGAAIGALVDRATPGRRLIYSAGWQPSRLSVSVAPILALEKRGIQVSFRF